MNWNDIKTQWIPRGRLSLWFTCYFFAGAFVFTAVPVFIEFWKRGVTLKDAFWSLPDNVYVTPVEIGLVTLWWAGLLWITFLSNYKRVTENDRRYVRLWSAAMIVLGAVRLTQHLIGTL